jgi:hypothetical protein
MARYPDLRAARRAIESLEAAGIDGNDIALVGEGALEAEHVDRRPERDARVLGHVTKWVLLGALLGAVIAAPISALCVGAVVLLWPGGLSHPLWAFALVVGWGIVAGLILGGFSALSRKTGFSESWEATFGDPGGRPVWLAIYTEDAAAVRTLPGTDPVEIRADPDVETRHPA